MTPKEKQDKEQQLERENILLKEQVAGLTKRVKELEAAKPASKSRQQAEATLKMLEQGPVTQTQLKSLNDKYPYDCVYYVRNLLKIDVKRVKTAAGTTYMLAPMYETFMEQQKKEKAAAEASKQEAKEEIPQAQAASHSTGAHAAVAV
jgi:hypothetical protein